jgi:competence protein ComEC
MGRRLRRGGGEAVLTALVVVSAFLLAEAFGAPPPFPLSLQPVAARHSAATAETGAAAAPPPGAAPAPAVRPDTEGPMVRLDVQLIGSGAGRAALVVSQGQAAVVDPGSQAVAAEVVQRLQHLGIRRLEAVLLVRPGPEAVQGLPLLLAALPVGRLVLPGPGRPGSEADFEGAVRAARAAGVPLASAVRGEVLPVGAASLEWLWPPAGLGQPGEGGGAGLVRIQAGQVAVLLAGGFDPAEEDALVRLGGDLRAQVLEVPGGGAKPLSPAFLHAVAPRVAVVGDGAAGTADGAVLQQLATAGVAVVHGDRLSDLQFSTDGRRLAVGFDPGPPLPPGPGETAAAAALQG